MSRNLTRSGPATVPGPGRPAGPWGVVRSLLALAFGTGDDRASSVAPTPQTSEVNASLTRLAATGPPHLQITLIQEALELLAPADCGALRERLGGDGTTPVDESSYTAAVTRFSARLAWVAAREASGIPPVQRQALGLLTFSGMTAHEVAGRLRLPLEVVEYWARLAPPMPERPRRKT